MRPGMRLRRLNLDRWRRAGVGCCLAMLWFGALGQEPGEMVTLHLRNGDRLTGVFLCEDTNEVVITTVWSRELSVPADEVVSREAATVEPAPPPPPPPLGPPLPLAI